MKLCPQCGEIKPLTDFHPRSDRKCGYQSNCRKCLNARNRRDYHAKPGRKEAMSVTRKAYREEVVKWYQALKHMKPCTDCGLAYPYYVMHWDHLGDKVNGLARLARGGSKRRILEEIAKCELTCANCHAIRTHTRTLTAS